MSVPPDGYPPVPTPPASSMKKRPIAKAVLIVIAGAVVVFAGGWVIVSASPHATTATHTAATLAATTAAAPTASPSTATATTPTVSAPPASTTPAPPSSFKTVTAWYHGGGKALLDAIRADNNAIRDAANNNDSTAVRHACDQLVDDARAANNYAPIPDNQAQPHWADSLQLIIKGAFDCAGGFIPGHNDLLSTALEELNEGYTEENLVVARLNTLLG